MSSTSVGQVVERRAKLGKGCKYTRSIGGIRPNPNIQILGRSNVTMGRQSVSPDLTNRPPIGSEVWDRVTSVSPDPDRSIHAILVPYVGIDELEHLPACGHCFGRLISGTKLRKEPEPEKL